jgi:hypothetical protein
MMEPIDPPEDTFSPDDEIFVPSEEATNHHARRLRTYSLAAIASSLPLQDPSEEIGLEARFLLDRVEAVDPAWIGWSATLASYLAAPAPNDLPLLRLAVDLDLTMLEVLSMALAAAVEDDVMVGRVLAHLQSPLGGSRPTLGLLATSLQAVTPSGLGVIDVLFSGTAISTGLLSLLGEGVPLPERAISVPVPLCLALTGIDAVWPGTTIGLGSTSQVPLPSSVLETVEQQAIGLRSAGQRALVIRSGSSAEGKSVAMAVASALHSRPLFIATEQLQGVGPWMLLRHLLPVFSLELAPGERKILPSIPGYLGPMLALCGPDGSVETADGSVLNWTLGVPPREERRRLWREALGSDVLAADMAAQHRHGSGRIAHLGKLAHHQSAVSGRDRPIMADVVAASWTGEGAGLDALAQPLRASVPDEALVMTDALRRELEGLLARCRFRDGLVDGLGASASTRYYAGVRALFVGPSGTGKTLAAGWLAGRLSLPLYRVDLASITSKYIGETEKNLAQLLARAEHAEVVLLFDEADSLFGKRTDVREANDRFANAQTNYLLQRIETFDGITILTSNSRARFDSAFSRRLDTIIEFPIPGPEERRALWQSHLGTQHDLTQRDLNRLAATADVCGGNIRNAVLAAAVLARDEHLPISYGHIVQGLTSEYKKLERHLPVELKSDA